MIGMIMIMGSLMQCVFQRMHIVIVELMFLKRTMYTGSPVAEVRGKFPVGDYV